MNNKQAQQIEEVLSLLSKERVNTAGLGAPINILKRLLEDCEISTEVADNIPTKGQLVYIKDSEDDLWDMRYYSHTKDNMHYCFNNQQKIGGTTFWNFVEVNNPLIKFNPTPEVDDNMPSASDYLNDNYKPAMLHAEHEALIKKIMQIEEFVMMRITSEQSPVKIKNKLIEILNNGKQ